MNEALIKMRIENDRISFMRDYANFLLERLNEIPRKAIFTDTIDKYVVNKASIVDISFSCELFLKSILLEQGLTEQDIKEHNLYNLFNKLSQKNTQEICSLLKLSEGEIKTILSNEDTSRAYEKSRYIHEKDKTGNPDYEFLSALSKVLYQTCNGEEFEFKYPLKNMSINGLGVINLFSEKEQLTKRYLEELEKRRNHHKSNHEDEFIQYIDDNITACDLALYIELSFKYFIERGQGHEYKKLYNKLTDAIKFLFAKGIYSEYELNQNNNVNVVFAYKSLLFPNDFKEIYKQDRDKILDSLKNTFQNSRFSTLDYFYNYPEIDKLYNLINSIMNFVSQNAEKINQVYELREFLQNEVGIEFYTLGISLDELSKLNRHYLKAMYKNIGYELFENKNLLLLTEDNQTRLMSLYNNKDIPYINYILTNSSKINNEFLNKLFNQTHHQKIVNVFTYLNTYYCSKENSDEKSKMKSLKSDYSTIDYDYFNRLISNPIINKYPELVISLVNADKEYDLNRIINLIGIVSNENVFEQPLSTTVVNNLLPIIDMPDTKLTSSLVMYKYLITHYGITNYDMDAFDFKILSRTLDEFKELETIRIKCFSNNIAIQEAMEFLSNANPASVQQLLESNYLLKYPQIYNPSFLSNSKAIKNFLVLAKEVEIPVDINPEVFSLDLPEIKNLFSHNFNFYLDHKFISYYEKRRVTKVLEATCSYPKLQTPTVLTYGKNTILSNYILSEDSLVRDLEGYTEEEQQAIIQSIEKILINIEEKTLKDDIGFIDKLYQLQILRENPILCLSVDLHDNTFYNYQALDTLYRRVSFNVLQDETTNNTPIELTKKTQEELLNRILNDTEIDYKNIDRINALLRNKKIIDNMTDDVWHYGDAKFLNERIQELKSLKIINNIDLKQYLSDVSVFYNAYIENRDLMVAPNSEDKLNNTFKTKVDYVNKINELINTSHNSEERNYLQEHCRNVMINIPDTFEQSEMYNTVLTTVIQMSNEKFNIVEIIKDLNGLQDINDIKELIQNPELSAKYPNLVTAVEDKNKELNLFFDLKEETTDIFYPEVGDISFDDTPLDEPIDAGYEIVEDYTDQSVLEKAKLTGEIILSTIQRALSTAEENITISFDNLNEKLHEKAPNTMQYFDDIASKVNNYFVTKKMKKYIDITEQQINEELQGRRH